MKYLNYKPDAKSELDVLVELLDNETEAHRVPDYPLVLFGELEHSPFLRAVKRKAEDYGIQVVMNTWPHNTSYRVVVDKETAGPFGYISKFEDIDKVWASHDGLSCVAHAIALLLTHLNLVSGKDITIVGRGHSVKGLAKCLIDHDATVTVAHSKTECLLSATKNKDVVIYATPEITHLPAYDTKELVIDLGGCIKHPDWFMCECVSGIGKLTVSVLLNRFVTGG